MRLLDLQLRNFRNYESLDLSFEPGVNLILGNNAQGKTNLLEAISYAGSGKSFRAQKTSEMGPPLPAAAWCWSAGMWSVLRLLWKFAART